MSSFEEVRKRHDSHSETPPLDVSSLNLWLGLTVPEQTIRHGITASQELLQDRGGISILKLRAFARKCIDKKDSLKSVAFFDDSGNGDDRNGIGRQFAREIRKVRIA